MKPEHTPKSAGYQMPAEWEHHESVWLAWPSAADLWEDELPYAQKEFLALCEAIADPDSKTGVLLGERLNIVVNDKKSAADAEKRLAHLAPEFHLIPFGDIWFRDTLPVFLRNAKGERASVSFKFNGWGNKYSLPGDDTVGMTVAKEAGFKTFATDWIFEGGALEVDGEGTCLTSRQCLLNPNRNPALGEKEIEKIICDYLGVDKVLWVGEGLKNDHTDGHIDTIVRFIAPAKVMIMTTDDPKDPNYEILKKIDQELQGQVDAKGRRLEIVRIPSPGVVLDFEGKIMPASYVNFYISNTKVIVPVYGSPNDEKAVEAIGKHFLSRQTIGLSAKSILEGGGAFHCISQQVPSKER